MSDDGEKKPKEAVIKIGLPAAMVSGGFGGGMIFGNTKAAEALLNALIGLMERSTPAEAYAAIGVLLMGLACWLRQEHFRQDFGKMFMIGNAGLTKLDILLDRRMMEREQQGKHRPIGDERRQRRWDESNSNEESNN